jgi:hypothetical protein
MDLEGRDRNQLGELCGNLFGGTEDIHNMSQACQRSPDPDVNCGPQKGEAEASTAGGHDTGNKTNKKTNELRGP